MIRLSKSSLGKAEKNSVMKVLNKEFLGMGEEVQLFENQLSDFFNREVVCVVNGTSALHLALQAIGVSKGDEVLVQSVTYLSSYQSITATGAKPISCDVNINNMSINLEDAKKKITSKTKAIMPVLYAGNPGNLVEVYKFAKKYNLTVVEDSAHAFGSVLNGKRIGSFGDISCFSFDGIKNITSGEGGCIVTNNKKVLSHVRDARLLSVEKDSLFRVQNKRSWEFDVKFQGWRYHMSNIMAAIGIIQLKKINKIKKKRYQLVRQYINNLKRNKNIKLFDFDYQNIIQHIFPIRILKLNDRAKLQKFFIKKKIQIGFHYYPNHKLTYFKKNKNYYLKNTDIIQKEVITLPLHMDLKKSDVDYVCKILNEWFKSN
mgnify:CR=1 FL=1